MKKAKVMLSALGICAILATTFAFTAQKFNNKIVFTGSSATDCTHVLENRVITTTGSALIYASTDQNTTNCQQTYTVVPANDN
jgi:hypothetical protein